MVGEKEGGSGSSAWLEELSRELRVPSRRSRPELSRWREEFIESGTEGLRLARRANFGNGESLAGSSGQGGAADDEGGDPARAPAGWPEGPTWGPADASEIGELAEEGRWPVKVLCKATGVARSSFYFRKKRPSLAQGQGRRRPTPGQLDDGELARAIKEVLAQSPFSGEGYRKAWVRLRREKGIRVSAQASWSSWTASARNGWWKD